MTLSNEGCQTGKGWRFLRHPSLLGYDGLLIEITLCTNESITGTCVDFFVLSFICSSSLSEETLWRGELLIAWATSCVKNSTSVCAMNGPFLQNSLVPKLKLGESKTHFLSS